MGWRHKALLIGTGTIIKKPGYTDAFVNNSSKHYSVQLYHPWPLSNFQSLAFLRLTIGIGLLGCHFLRKQYSPLISLLCSPPTLVSPKLEPAKRS